MQREKMVFETTPISIEPKNPNNFLFMNLDDIEVARQLTLIDHDLFFSIKPREFLNRFFFSFYLFFIFLFLLFNL